ncbi:hypothetical protein [Streptomyces sp. NPDC048496]|uniref:hypothetical protein n=1 Tax=Streptomyces sp. NPDC048496 TaxID=3365558 RepID=UPI00371227CE
MSSSASWCSKSRPAPGGRPAQQRRERGIGLYLIERCRETFRARQTRVLVITWREVADAELPELPGP